MKKIQLIIIVSIVFIIQSCSSDFKVGADYKDYTVVFGLLSRSDTAHYIKITKGFYDETQNNLIVAQIADSIYYNNLDVKIYKMNNGVAVQTYNLYRVDLNLEGYVKDSGVFVSTPNYAYKFKDSVLLDATKTYKLVIKNLTTGKEVYGETDIIDDSKMRIKTPQSGTSDRIVFVEKGKSNSFIFTCPSNASIFDLTLRFRYAEKNSLTQEMVYNKYVDLPLQKNIPNTAGTLTVPIKTEDFYRFLQSELKIAPSYISRYVDTPDVIVTAGGAQLKTYVDVTTSQGGITYDQIKPYYTNMKGENVLGLFSTRGKAISLGTPYTIPTTDSIINSSYTKTLNIVGVSPK